MMTNFIMAVNDNIHKFEIRNNPDIWVGHPNAAYWDNEGNLKCDTSKMVKIDTKANGELIFRSYMNNGDVLIAKTPVEGAVRTELMLNSTTGVVCLVNKKTGSDVYYFRHKRGFVCHSKNVIDLDDAAAMVG